MGRDFSAELAAARAAEDWDAHASIWEDRQISSVDDDGEILEGFSIVNIRTDEVVGSWYPDFETARFAHEAFVACGVKGLRVVRGGWAR